MWWPFKKRKLARIIVLPETAEQARCRERRRAHSEAVYARIRQTFAKINRQLEDAGIARLRRLTCGLHRCPFGPGPCRGCPLAKSGIINCSGPDSNEYPFKEGSDAEAAR